MGQKTVRTIDITTNLYPKYIKIRKSEAFDFEYLSFNKSDHSGAEEKIHLLQLDLVAQEEGQHLQ